MELIILEVKIKYLALYETQFQFITILGSDLIIKKYSMTAYNYSIVCVVDFPLESAIIWWREY